MGWNSDDILTYLKTENGYLHLIYEEDTCVGMFVVSYLGSEVHITVAQTFDYHLKSLYNAVMTVIDLGRKQGCTKASFGSNRRGWCKIAKKLGFVETEPFTFERLI